MRLKRTVLVGFASILFIGCTPRTHIDLDAERTLLEEAVEYYHSSMAALTPQAAADLYADNVLMIPKGKQMLESNTAAENYLIAAARNPGFDPSFETLVVHVSDSGAMGFSVARVRVNFDGPDGETVTDVTRDVHFWEKDSVGDWKIVLDIWNAAPLSTD